MDIIIGVTVVINKLILDKVDIYTNRDKALILMMVSYS